MLHPYSSVSETLSGDTIKCWTMDLSCQPAERLKAVFEQSSKQPISSPNSLYKLSQTALYRGAPHRSPQTSSSLATP